MSGQLSLFSAAAQEPQVADFAGLLCGPGQLVRRGNAPGARVSVVLDEPWRVAALQSEFGLRDLPAEVVAVDQARPAIVSLRSPFTTRLESLAAAWATSGAGKRPPGRLILDGSMLRLWYVAAGRPWGAGHALGLGENDSACWAPVGAALSAAGLPAAFVGPRGDGPAYRLTGRKRLSRLAELVGEPPACTPPGQWPD